MGDLHRSSGRLIYSIVYAGHCNRLGDIPITWGKQQRFSGRPSTQQNPSRRSYRDTNISSWFTAQNHLITIGVTGALCLGNLSTITGFAN